MVATDTVIGIAGALVLAAVMVGIFAYEYNAVGESGGDGFATRYPFLDPAEDIDGDGVANADDDDLDGDGVANADDGRVAVLTTGSGPLPADPGPGAEGSFDFPFTAHAGARETRAWANWTVTALPGPAPMQPSWDVVLVAEKQTWPMEVVVQGGQASASVTAGIQPGDLAVEVRTRDGSLVGGEVHVTAEVVYGPGDGAAGPS